MRQLEPQLNQVAARPIRQEIILADDGSTGLSGVSPEKSRFAAALPTMMLVALGLMLAARILWTHPNNSPGGRDEIKYLLLARQISGVAAAPLSHRPQYPPGWPILLALNGAGGGSLATAHYLNLALTWLSVGLVVVFARRYVSIATAVSIGLVFFANRLTVNMGDTLLSEPTFMVLFTLLLILAQRTAPDSLTGRQTLVLALLATGCRAVRTAGISIFAGLVLYLLTCPGLTRRKRLAYVAIACLPLAAFEPTLWAVHDNASILSGLSGSGYLGQWLHGVVAGVVAAEPDSAEVRLPIASLLWQLPAHFRNAASAMIPFDPAWWKPAIIFQAAGALVLVAGAITTLQQLATRKSLVAAILASYVLLVLCWPSHDLRFFWPLIPFVWCAAVWGIARAASRLRADRSTRAVGAGRIACTSLAAAAAICSIWSPSIGRDYKRVENSELAASLRWVEANSAETSPPRVASVSDFQVQFHRPGWLVVALPYGDEPDLQLARIKQHEVRWLVEQRTKARYYQGLEQRGVISLAHSTPKVVVYRVDIPGSGAGQ